MIPPLSSLSFPFPPELLWSGFVTLVVAVLGSGLLVAWLNRDLTKAQADHFEAQARRSRAEADALISAALTDYETRLTHAVQATLRCEEHRRNDRDTCRQEIAEVQAEANRGHADMLAKHAALAARLAVFENGNNAVSGKVVDVESN